MRQQNTLCLVGIAVLILGGTGSPAAAGPSREQATPTSKPAPQAQESKPRAGFEDWWITMKIHSQFVPEDALEDSNVDVDTVNRVVTLSGTVATEAGRKRAVELARATDGVKSVNDKLRIAPESDRAPGATGREEAARDTAGAAKAGSRRVTDGWIKSKVYAQFLTEDALQDSDIDVDVKSGVVTLNGTVSAEAGRARAVAIAKATDGVKNVNDALKVAKR
jgi:hyperosmotically inducible protein